MDPYVITALLAPLVSALTHLHAQGLVHRDLKPANLFLSRVEGAAAPVLRLLDFGIARKLDDDVRLTEASAVMGSPAYMAPEQARGLRDVGPAADQYAFGIIVYEALTGQLPHQGDSLLAMLSARRDAPATPVETHRADLPPAFAAAVMRSLAVLPEDRHASVEAFAKAMNEGLSTVSTLPDGPVLALDPAVETAPAQTPEPIAPDAPTPRRAWSFAAFAAGLAAAAALLASQSHPSPRAATARQPAPATARQPAPTIARALAPVAVPVAPVALPVAPVAADDAVARAPAPSHRAAPPRARTRPEPASPLVRAMQQIYRDLPQRAR
jgi:serine/threonine-protein kinase